MVVAKKAVKHAPDDADAHALLAEALLGAGKRHRAADEARAALAIDAGHERARAVLRSVAA